MRIKKSHLMVKDAALAITCLFLCLLASPNKSKTISPSTPTKFLMFIKKLMLPTNPTLRLSNIGLTIFYTLCKTAYITLHQQPMQNANRKLLILFQFCQGCLTQ